MRSFFHPGRRDRFARGVGLKGGRWQIQSLYLQEVYRQMSPRGRAVSAVAPEAPVGGAAKKVRKTWQSGWLARLRRTTIFVGADHEPLLHALEMVIQRHEAAFGALEVNVQRRVRPGVTGERPGV